MILPLSLMNKKIPEKLFLLTGILGFVFILILTFFHQQPPVFDEIPFVKNLHLFQTQGLSRQFLINVKDQAPGPLYEFVHYTFSPLTNFTTPGIRLVNVFLLGLTILLMAKIISMLRNISFSEALVFAVALVAVPMVWQVTGLALTEMPTMFFSMLSIWLLLLAMKWEDAFLKSTGMAILSGLALGLAILGRSPFLIVGFSSAILLFQNFGNAKRWRTLLIFGICALSISVPVFIIWNGLVPPHQAYVGKGFSLWHGLLAFAYAAFFTVLLAPNWFYFNKKTIFYLAGCYLVFLLVNIFIAHYEYAPLDKTLAKVFPVSFMKLYPLMISPLLATLSFYFVACSFWQGWKKRSDPVFLFLLVAGMLLLASCFKVTHLFSTRYVAQASPFFLLLFPGFDKFTVSRLVRILIAMAIGFMSLETYIHRF